MQFLQQYREGGEVFLQRIVTGDEISVYQTSKHGVERHVITSIKFRSIPSAGKVMLTLSWDLNGPILENCQVSIVL
jgi:hypothetical protein